MLPKRPLTSLEAGRVPALLELFERNWVKLVDDECLATATLQWIQPPQRTERMPTLRTHGPSELLDSADGLWVIEI